MSDVESILIPTLVKNTTIIGMRNIYDYPDPRVSSVTKEKTETHYHLVAILIQLLTDHTVDCVIGDGGVPSCKLM